MDYFVVWRVVRSRECRAWVIHGGLNKVGRVSKGGMG